MNDEWTPLDDLGRAQAGMLHSMRQFGPAMRRFEGSRVSALRSFDRLLATLADGRIDWSEATPEEAEQMAGALDVIHGVRDTLGGLDLKSR